MHSHITRREMFGITAGAALTAAGIDWIYVRDGRGGIAIAATASSEWTPQLFTETQAEAVAALCETIIPKTDTPGARDARVHEFVDLQLAGEAEAQQQSFIEGLDWLESRCKKQFGNGIGATSQEDLAALLEPISDLHENQSEDLKLGINFFGNIKRRTIFAFYTTEEGWVQDLKMPAHPSLTATMDGCPEVAHGDA